MSLMPSVVLYKKAAVVAQTPQLVIQTHVNFFLEISYCKE